MKFTQPCFKAPFSFSGKAIGKSNLRMKGSAQSWKGFTAQHCVASNMNNGSKKECLIFRIANKEDAYLWRSQTLRLLLPPAATASEKERELRYFTETSMDRVVDLQTTSAAQYLVSDKARANCEAKLRAIYLEAATISYNLWTRTFLKCTTLKDWNHPGFHPDDKHMILHSSVDYESHEDQLVGKAISIMVHPLLEAYGSDKGKDFDHGRVWARRLKDGLIAAECHP
ncbi:hypothetical protein EYC84_005911 [Monilinia fructicola]|uniref:Uncharacterized protein n=1 Tax=Monilinia fructicola TaxID=38448 RepID=A0A5M9K2T6_MONFR|nr:hypothetical protein EYC84_005911 [Monilinia fructicola]